MKNTSKCFIFCIVGGTTAVIDFILFNIFFKMGLDFILSRLVAISFAILYNFNMNRRITFSARENPIKKQLPKYFTVYSISISVNLLVSIIVLGILGENTLNANIAAVSGIATGIPISFLGSLLWTFKQ